MSLSDTFADFLTRVRNASRARLKYVDINPNKMIIKVVELLKREGFISDFRLGAPDGKRKLRLYLKYDRNRDPIIAEAVRVSKPGRRIYVSCDEIYPIKAGTGKMFITTNKGVVTGEEAKKARVGGEYLCYVA